MERPRIPNYDKEKTFDWEYVFELNRFIEWQDRQLKILNLKNNVSNDAVFCACIDRCSSKREDYFCRSKRKCVHKVK